MLKYFKFNIRDFINKVNGFGFAQLFIELIIPILLNVYIQLQICRF